VCKLFLCYMETTNNGKEEKSRKEETSKKEKEKIA
jgi:hypothetical protein